MKDERRETARIVHVYLMLLMLRTQLLVTIPKWDCTGPLDSTLMTSNDSLGFSTPVGVSTEGYRLMSIYDFYLRDVPDDVQHF